MLVVTDPDLPGQQVTNLNGLGTIDITDIIEAANGQKWIAGNGRLIKYNGMASLRYPMTDDADRPFLLTRLADDGAFLWLGSDAGLILFSKDADGGQIQDAYQMFDNLNPSPHLFDIELTSDSIFLATDAGLAVANRSSHNGLKSPANWKGYDRAGYPELGSSIVTAVRRFEGRTYVGTGAGLYWLDQESDSLIAMPFAVGAMVRQLKIDNDSLFVYSDAGLGVIVDSVVSLIATPGTNSTPMAGAVYGDTHWLGSLAGGLFYETGGGFNRYVHTGLPDNIISDVTITPNGLLVVLFQSLGPYELHGGEWVRRQIAIRNRAIAMQSDNAGQLYVGTFGAGLSRISDTVAQFTTSNSTLQEAGSPGSNYVVCYDVAISDRYFFGVNFEPRDDTRLAIADLNQMDDLSGWTSLSVSDGLNGDQMVSVDHFEDWVAVGSGLGGAYLYYLGPDPFNKADDSVVHYFQTQSNFRYRIVSDVVRVVRFSPAGELWIGTNFGISRWDAGVERMVDFNLPAGFGPDITALEFDTRDNIWIGAKNGLARVDGLTGLTQVFTTANSGLVNDFVFNMTTDPSSGNLYVSTPNGLSVLLSSIGRPTEDIEAVLAFPNPFVISSSADRLNFNIAGNATLRIFTVSGELVAERSEPVWDGRNAASEPVASGVYLFILTDDDGNAGRGKFLLVRD
jgi:ligand-binding sensor domain-containing protein